MTLVNIDPHVILHQKTHVPRVVNFFESQKASQHPVCNLRFYIFFFRFLVGLTKFTEVQNLFGFGSKILSTITSTIMNITW